MMMGAFGASVGFATVLCFLAILVSAFIGSIVGFEVENRGWKYPVAWFWVTMIVLIVALFSLILGPLGSNGYRGEGRYVENVEKWEGGKREVVPMVEVEGYPGQYEVEGSGIVGYEIGDMIPVECYGNECEVK